jgi:hypothetical protein
MISYNLPGSQSDTPWRPGPRSGPPRPGLAGRPGPSPSQYELKCPAAAARRHSGWGQARRRRCQPECASESYKLELANETLKATVFIGRVSGSGWSSLSCSLSGGSESAGESLGTPAKTRAGRPGDQGSKGGHFVLKPAALARSLHQQINLKGNYF